MLVFGPSRHRLDYEIVVRMILRQPFIAAEFPV